MEAFDWVETAVWASILVVLVFTFLGRTNTVSGISMVPTFHTGERLISSNLFYQPQNGDVIVLQPGMDSPDPSYIKRVIATEGQTVDIDFEQGIVTVDGKVLDEPYINEPTHLEEGMEFPATVPENCIFVMGDNRNHSSDSRNPNLGMVDKRFVIGKVLLRIFPFGKFSAAPFI